MLAQFGLMRDAGTVEFESYPTEVVEMWRGWSNDYIRREEGSVTSEDFKGEIYGKFEAEIRENFKNQQIVIPASLPCW